MSGPATVWSSEQYREGWSRDRAAGELSILFTCIDRDRDKGKFSDILNGLLGIFLIAIRKYLEKSNL